MQSFKQFMKRKRKSLNISFGTMAKELDYTSEQLYDIENGETKIPLDFIEKIQKIFILDNVEMQKLKHIIYKSSQQKISKKDTEIQKLQQKLENNVFNTPHPKTPRKSKNDICNVSRSKTLKKNIETQNLRNVTPGFFRQKFKQFMQRKRWSLDIDRTEMANKLGYDINYFYAIENGRDRIPSDYIERMEQTFNLNEDELKELYYIVIELQNEQETEKNTRKRRLTRFITEKLDDLGMTKAEMIRMLGCSSSYIYHIENGRRNISLSFIEKLQEILNLNEAELKELHQMRKENKKVKKQTNKG